MLAVQQVRGYWRAQAWLVSEAERVMIAEAAGDVTLDRAKVAAQFAELRAARRALGRSSFAALRRMLPFSRNDYWEVSELRQRIGRR